MEKSDLIHASSLSMKRVDDISSTSTPPPTSLNPIFLPFTPPLRFDNTFSLSAFSLSLSLFLRFASHLQMDHGHLTPDFANTTVGGHRLTIVPYSACRVANDRLRDNLLWPESEMRRYNNFSWWKFEISNKNWITKEFFGVQTVDNWLEVRLFRSSLFWPGFGRDSEAYGLTKWIFFRLR